MRAYGLKRPQGACGCCREWYSKAVARNDNRRAVVDGLDEYAQIDYDDWYWDECWDDSECTCPGCRPPEPEPGPLKVSFLELVRLG